MSITDEILVAYVDGELSAADAAPVEHALAKDAALAARAAQFADSKTAMRRAFSPAPAVSAGLEARVRAMATDHAALRLPNAPAGTVIDLAARRRVTPAWQLPAAAAVLLAVGIGGGWFVGAGDDAASGGLQVAGLTEPEFSAAMGTLPSGQKLTLPDGTELAAVATFRDGDGTLCREVEQTGVTGGTVVAIACRAEATWEVRFAMATASGAEGYAPASSLDTLDAYLSATAAGAPLSAEDEAAALATTD